MSGGISNMLVEDLHVWDAAAGLQVKTDRGRGGYITNSTIANMTMERVKIPIRFSSGSNDHPDEWWDPNALPVPVPSILIACCSSNASKSLTRNPATTLPSSVVISSLVVLRHVEERPPFTKDLVGEDDNLVGEDRIWLSPTSTSSDTFCTALLLPIVMPHPSVETLIQETWSILKRICRLPSPELESCINEALFIWFYSSDARRSAQAPSSYNWLECICGCQCIRWLFVCVCEELNRMVELTNSNITSFNLTRKARVHMRWVKPKQRVGQATRRQVRELLKVKA
ncbi:hypothetical protein MRB53_016802 [Persea americana]|uniref:Uncharacterized protein n=1 Tax=Persea americana TaxID=3435 RepID=A0ACC2M3T0_PERAE|nr:hypothetical protein MRB53_016802 [Persea americana]